MRLGQAAVTYLALAASSAAGVSNKEIYVENLAVRHERKFGST